MGRWLQTLKDSSSLMKLNVARMFFFLFFFNSVANVCTFKVV